MTNRTQLPPSINPWSNVEIKGDLTIEDDLTIGGDLFLPISSPFRFQQLSMFIPSILAGDAAVVTLPCEISGTIISISVNQNVQSTVGSAIYTPSILLAGVATPITNGALTVTTAIGLNISVNTTPSGANVISSSNVLKVVVSGGNANAGIAYVTFLVRIAS